MMKIQSSLDIHTDTFVHNKSHMLSQIKIWKQRMADIRKGGASAAQERQLKQGKLLVRERIDQLLDAGAPFLELSMFAGYQMYDHPLPAGGIITGIGMIAGQACMIMANDPTIKGGTYYPITVKKQLRAQSIAEENRLPCIYLVDSGGAYLPKQDEVFADQQHFGRIFYNQARLSAKRIPQIAVVMGSCTAGGAYLPSMSDEVIMVREQATLFLGGPPLVQAATGERVDAETLGGAQTHAALSGVSDYTADNDIEALNMTRQIVKRLNQHQTLNSFSKNPTPPHYDPEEILGIVNIDARKPYVIHEIIARVVDHSEFDEFKPDYGKTLICGFAHIHGYLVGMLANQGVLFSESALKGTHFMMLCNQRNIPLIFLQNITGFMVGKKYEHSGIAKHGAKMLHAIASSQVPKFTIMIGNSYGAGNYAMCGRAYDPRLLFSWPNARIGVMGKEQAEQVLKTLRKKKHKPLQDTSQPDIIQQYTKQETAYYASAHLWDDGIIDPRDTRCILALCLSLSKNISIDPTDTAWGVIRM